MTVARLFLLPWLLVGLFLGKGLWMSMGVALVLLAVAHRQEWSVWKFAAVAIALLVTVPIVLILIGDFYGRP